MKNLLIFFALLLIPLPTISKDPVCIPITNADGYINDGTLVFVDPYQDGTFTAIVITYDDGVLYSNLQDPNDAQMDASMRAKLSSGNVLDSNFTFLIYEPTTATNKFTLQRKSEWQYAVLKPIGSSGDDYQNEATNYFEISKSNSAIILRKKYDFQVRKVTFFDITGRIINQFFYDSYQYSFDISNFSSGMYFFSFELNDKELLLKCPITK